MFSPSLVTKQKHLFLFCAVQLFIISAKETDIYHPVSNLTTNIVSCSLCDSLDLPLRGDADDVRPFENFGDNATCTELSVNLSKPENRVRCSESFLGFTEACCDRTNSTHLNDYDCDHKIREQIFSRDRLVNVPPYKSLKNRSIKIEVGLYYWMVQDLNVKESTADITLTIQLKWHDPRLAWNITPSMCLPVMTDVRASESVEESEIWVPNFNLVNRVEGTEGFAPTRAFVAHDGTVLWSQVGKVKVACSYRGLGMIPFDTLGCQLVFGNPVTTYGYEFVATESVNQVDFIQRYKDFEMDPNKTKISYFKNQNGVIYDFYFTRAPQFYQTKIIVPTVFFTYASFGMFLLSMNSGERLGYGITVVLVIVAQGIVINDYIPLCREKLWLDRFIEVSTYFTYVCLLETIIMSWLFNLHQRYQQYQKKEMDSEEDDNVHNHDTSSTPLQAEEGDLKEDSSAFQGNPSNKTGILRGLYKPRDNLLRNMKKVEDTEKYVRRVDTLCLIFIPIAYTIFIIVMYSTKSRFDDGDNHWIVGESVGQEL